MGNCQHFASAATLLLRASNHAARPVVGLRQDWPSEINPEEIIQFDARHAHAWIEVWGHNSWYRVDPTLSVSTTVEPHIEPLTEREEAEGTSSSLNAPTSSVWSQYVLLQIIGSLGVLILFSFLWYKLTRQTGIHDAKPLPSTRRSKLRSQERELERLASQLNMSLQPHWTSQHIAEQIARRVNLDISGAINLYNEARFGNSTVEVSDEIWFELAKHIEQHRHQERIPHNDNE